MLGLFIVVALVEQRLFVLPNTAGKKELYGSNTCYIYHNQYDIYIAEVKVIQHLSCCTNYQCSISKKKKKNIYIIYIITKSLNHCIVSGTCML